MLSQFVFREVFVEFVLELGVFHTYSYSYPHSYPPPSSDQHP